MSTRGLIGVRRAGKWWGTYKHMDCSPEELGADMIKFVQTHLTHLGAYAKLSMKMDAIKEVANGKHPSMATLKYYWELGLASGIYHNADAGHYFDIENMDYHAMLFPYQGTAGLEAIMRGDLKHWINSKAFLKDSLFCEFAYIINLGSQTLEFYEGCQRKGKTATGQDLFGACKKVGEVSLERVSLADLATIYPGRVPQE